MEATELNAQKFSMRQNTSKEEEEEDLFDPFDELTGKNLDTLPKIFGMNYFKITIEF